MAGASRAGAGLPEEIILWEILVRLPPKILLRCRAVCRAWHQATSTHGFLLDHHARQPSSPLICSYKRANDDGGASLEIIAFDHRAGLAASDPLESVARLNNTSLHVEASCDGLLVLSNRFKRFSICNPATRQYAPLPQIKFFDLMGMYKHRPTGEYRLVLYWLTWTGYEHLVADHTDGFYIFALGSSKPPRHIGCKEVILSGDSFLFRGNLHWQESISYRIMVFDTTAESFRRMSAPFASGHATLFEMDGLLSMSSFHGAIKTIDIWQMQDYEVWAYKCHVYLPIAQVVDIQNFLSSWTVVAASCDADVLFLVQFGDFLLQIDIDGKLVAMFNHTGLRPTQLLLKQTLVSHTFFPALEGYVVNALPFT